MSGTEIQRVICSAAFDVREAEYIVIAVVLITVKAQIGRCYDGDSGAHMRMDNNCAVIRDSRQTGAEIDSCDIFQSSNDLGLNIT